jgi:hypothetical protein
MNLAGTLKPPSAPSTSLACRDGPGLRPGEHNPAHWTYAELLPLVGATHEEACIVKDRMFREELLSHR